MSACLSVTVITRLDTRLKAATAMIRVRMMNIMRFSICTAGTRWRSAATSRGSRSRSVRMRCQLAAPPAAPRACPSSAAARRHGAADAVQPLRILDVHEGQRRVELVVPGLEDADHGELLHAAAMTPAGVTWPCGAISMTLSPTRRRSDARQLAAEHDVELARREIVEAALPDLCWPCPTPRFLVRQRCRA